jgi:RNA polymerase sigma-70 factor (ECF subfamily)
LEPEITDEQLMARIKNGQLDQLNSLFDRYSKRLYGYFLKSTLSKDESDDLTQELFIRLMKYRKSYKEGQRFELWVFQIARNMVKDHYRKMKVQSDYFNPKDVMPEVMEEDENGQWEREEQLYRAMKRLPDEKRELLVLSKFDGMKYEQLASLRKTTVANIKVQVHRTLKELKDIYFELN